MSVNDETPVPPSATAKSVVNVNDPNFAAAYDAIDTLPVVAPVNVPVAAMNVSAYSSQPTKILASSPLSKT